jgi:hypothetical protein
VSTTRTPSQDLSDAATPRLDHTTDDVTAAELAVDRGAKRLRALLERTGEAVDLALDSDWRVCIDILLDVSDEIRAELGR